MRTVLISAVMAVGALLLPGSMIDPLARALIPAVALMATGIFPCMTLAIGAMKAEGRTPALIEDLYVNLRNLLRVLISSFLYAVLAVIALAVAISLASPDAWQGFSAKQGSFHVTPVQGAAGFAAFVLGMLAGKLRALGISFFVVLEINKKQALLVARSKVRSERDAAIEVVRADKFATDDDTPRPLRRANDTR